MKRIVTGFIILLMTACTSVGLVPQKPQVELKNVSLGKISLTEVELHATLDVLNPNDYALNLSAIDYQVDALGMTLGKGSSLEAIRLAPGVKQSVKLPLTLTTASAIKFGQAYYSQAQKQLPVTLLATVKVNSPVGPLSLDFKDVKDIKEKAP
ncbi:MAG TPA: LEA type 2 family protein [Oligoflexus sp.]|uniref:LEA type 2 family protein n=1 Tax=Oligoflexus sp. TaxID=1971216 RepID=UPI002D671667|nr:LEA type 2 family protein [Oligoflexus sp.]HYX37070.1 LEA type 2 family protein [Oligoflexus sp.]